MPRYLVQVNASNLLVDMDGRRGKYGFIALRKVEAADRLAAGQLAVQMVKDDEEIRALLLNEPADAPVFEAQKVGEGDGTPVADGRIWYEMNPKRWWQFWRRL